MNKGSPKPAFPVGDITRIAAKQWKCEKCGKIIKPGDEYVQRNGPDHQKERPQYLVIRRLCLRDSRGVIQSDHKHKGDR